jgi:hypothetical protein
MLNTKTNNTTSLINFNLTVLVSFLLITLSLFAVIISTSAKAQSSTTTSNPSSASSTPTNTGSPVAVTGTGTAGNTISIVLPDGSTATTTVKSDGTWSIIPLTSQSAGTVTVTELSPTGVIVTPAKTITYVGGITTPVATSTTPKISIKDPYVCPGKITGYVDNNKATVTVVLSKDGVVVLTIPAIVNSDGNWSMDIANKLPDGVYSNKFTATYNGMIATGTYDINHKNNCASNSTNSTIRTGGMNLIASIVAFSGIVLGLYFVLIKKFSR